MLIQGIVQLSGAHLPRVHEHLLHFPQLNKTQPLRHHHQLVLVYVEGRQWNSFFLVLLVVEYDTLGELPSFPWLQLQLFLFVQLSSKMSQYTPYHYFLSILQINQLLHFAPAVFYFLSFPQFQMKIHSLEAFFLQICMHQ